MRGKVEISGINTASLQVLKNDEMVALLQRAHNGDDAAREQLIQGNLRLVLSVVQRFLGRGESTDDLFQVGCIGLIKAIDHFDISQGVRFSTYGVPMIIGHRERKGVLPMTRKQALNLAIQALTKDGKTEAAATLESLLADLPVTCWSDAAIRDAVEQYILEHGRTPPAGAFRRAGLPSERIIRRRYRQPLRSWLAENYPAALWQQGERAEKTAAFRKECRRLLPVGGKDFNRRRDRGICCWETIAKYNGVTSWSALTEKLSLPLSPAEQAPVHTAFQVTVYPHYDFKD